MSNIPMFPQGSPPGSVDGQATAANRAPVMAPQTSNAPEMVRFMAAVMRFKWIILAAGILGGIVGLFAGRLVKPQYSAYGSIFIEPSDNRRGGGPIQAMQLLESYAWVELLKSFQVLDYVVEKENLFIEAGENNWMFADFDLKERFRPGRYRFAVQSQETGYLLTTAEGQEVDRGPVGEVVGDTAGFLWKPPALALEPGRVVEFTIRSPRDVSTQLRDQIDARMISGDASFLAVSLTGTSPRRVQRTVNAVMERFVEVATQLKRAKLDDVTGILEQQRIYAERNLRDAEMELEAFRVQTITMPAQDGAPLAGGVEQTRDPVFSNYFNMKVSLEDLRRDRVAIGSIVQQVAAGNLSLEAVNAIPSAREKASLQGLLNELTSKQAELRAAQLKRYTNEHPAVVPVISAIATLKERLIPEAIRELQAEIGERERDLEARIASAGGELQQIPPRQIEEARLARRVEIANALHGNLRSRFEEARLAAVSSVADVRVHDPAKQPSTPLKNLKLLILAGFGAGGIGLALLAALLIDRMDRRVRYPEQITGGMGLPILGAIPRVKGGLQAEDPDAIIQMSEAFRELRLAIVHAHGAAGPLLVSVTSPETGDGKSTIAGSLARVFAGQGHRVLLIDGDIRRGDLHRSLGLQRAPGLTDYLAGKATLDQILQPSSDGRFTLIGSGTRMQAGPELLGSPAMQHLIRTLRSQFAVIIVDTPPLGAGVDAYILGTTTGNMVMVLRTGRTDGQLAEAKLSLLDRLPVRILGAVLNDVPPSRLYRQYSYLPGYQAEDESVAALRAAGMLEDGEHTIA